MEDTLIVIFIAETDPEYVYQISSDVQKQFQKHLGINYSRLLSCYRRQLKWYSLQIRALLKLFPPLESSTQTWHH